MKHIVIRTWHGLGHLIPMTYYGIECFLWYPILQMRKTSKKCEVIWSSLVIWYSLGSKVAGIWTWRVWNSTNATLNIFQRSYAILINKKRRMP